MPTQLTNLQITHISLVPAGANKKTLIFKSQDQKNDRDCHTRSRCNDGSEEWSLSRDLAVLKTDKKENVVYSIVYSPDEVDTDGEYADSETIKKAAYGFMKQNQNRNIDTNHNFKNEDAYVAQSWLVKKGDPTFPDEKAGSWAVAIKIDSKPLQQALKSGKLKGISMAGYAGKKEGQSFDKSLLVKTLAKFFNKGHFFKSNEGNKMSGSTTGMNAEQVQVIVAEALQKQAVSQQAVAQTEALQQANHDLTDQVETLQKSVKELSEAVKKSQQDDNITKSETEDNGAGGIL